MALAASTPNRADTASTAAEKAFPYTVPFSRTITVTTPDAASPTGAIRIRAALTSPGVAPSSRGAAPPATISLRMYRLERIGSNRS